MPQSNKYLQFSLGGAVFLLPGSASLTIDTRDSLATNGAERTKVCAWRTEGSERWPAYALDRNLRVSHGEHWERAIFLPASPHPVGLAARDVQLLPGGEFEAVPFTPIGPAPTRAGHLFNAAWVRETEVTLIFDPNALAVFLLSLGA
ncbi:MAG: hypothetical protein ACE5LB_03920 [Acidiferrobacterales bacterium]